MPPVSTTPAELVAKFADGIVDTGGKFAMHPVVHLDLQISPRISKKFEMTPVLFSGAWGKMISAKIS